MMPRRVIKMGGSLLSDDRLVRRMTEWLDAQPPAQNMIIIGGGQCVDAMRELDARFTLDAAAMHWRCVRLLAATYEVAEELFPNWTAVRAASALRELMIAAPIPGTWLVAVDTFYSPATSAHSGLPIGWETTSDSIAAYLARCAAAQELVLLKWDRFNPLALQQMADLGIVDAAFPAALSAGTTVRIESLTSFVR